MLRSLLTSAHRFSDPRPSASPNVFTSLRHSPTLNAVLHTQEPPQTLSHQASSHTFHHAWRVPCHPVLRPTPSFFFRSLATRHSPPATIPFRIIFFTHPYQLTSLESYSYKKHGGGYVPHFPGVQTEFIPAPWGVLAHSREPILKRSNARNPQELKKFAAPPVTSHDPRVTVSKVTSHESPVTASHAARKIQSANLAPYANPRAHPKSPGLSSPPPMRSPHPHVCPPELPS